MECPHGINFEDSCGICDARVIMELKAQQAASQAEIERFREVMNSR